MILDHTQAAEFEITRRLFACLINEGLIGATIVQTPEFGVSTWLELQNLNESPGQPTRTKVQVATSSEARVSCTWESLESFMQPNDLTPPVIIEHKISDSNPAGSGELIEFHPATLFDIITA